MALPPPSPTATAATYTTAATSTIDIAATVATAANAATADTAATAENACPAVTPSPHFPSLPPFPPPYRLFWRCTGGARLQRRTGAPLSALSMSLFFFFSLRG